MKKLLLQQAIGSSAARSAVWMGVALLTCFIGCGRGSDQLAVYPVNGKVSVAGQPANLAFVALHPQNPNEKLARLRPHGRVNADGSYQLTTYEPDDGAPVGEYRVTIEWKASDEALISDQELDPESAQTDVDRLGGRYSDPATTPLTLSITPETRELPPLELTN